jgi:hypothetical protein
MCKEQRKLPVGMLDEISHTLVALFTTECVSERSLNHFEAMIIDNSSQYIHKYINT